MDACCEVCGKIACVDDGELDKGLVQLVCVGCKTLHYVTRNGCYAAPAQRRATARTSRSSPPPLRRHDAKKDAAALKRDSADRLDDLRVLARKSDEARESILPPPGDDQDDMIDAPPSVRELIRASQLPAPISAPAERGRSRFRAFGIGVAVVAFSFGALVTAHRLSGPKSGSPTAIAIEARRDEALESPAKSADPETGDAPLEPPPRPRLDAASARIDPVPIRVGARVLFDPRRAMVRPSSSDPYEPDPPASASASAAPSVTPAPSATSPSSLEEAMAAVVAEKPPLSFDQEVARAALLRVAVAVQGCKQTEADAARGSVSVTFAPSGAIMTISLDGPPFSGTQTGACIASLFKSIHLGAFSGPPVTMHRDFIIR